jgi:hypothetical protein
LGLGTPKSWGARNPRGVNLLLGLEKDPERDHITFLVVIYGFLCIYYFL